MRSLWFGSKSITSGVPINETIVGGTPGSILFVDSGQKMGQDNANLFWDKTNKRLGIGTNTPAATEHIAGAQSSAAWGANGIQTRRDAATYTDTDALGTRATGVANSIAQPTFAATNAVTITDAATFYIANAPTNGANVTLTRTWGIWQAAGNSRFDGNVAIGGTTVTTRNLNLPNNGTISMGSIGGGGAIYFYDPGDATYIGIKTISNQGLILSSYPATNNPINFRFNDTEVARFHYISSGVSYLGIGTNSPTNIISFTGQSAQTIWLERNTTSNTAGNSLTVQASGATSGATDKNGGDLILSSGIATGTGSAGIQFQTSKAQASTNTTDNTPATTVQLNGAGKITKYANVSTLGWGIPAVYGYVRPAQQVNALVTLATYTVGAVDGSFVVSGNINITVATASLVGMTCTYTDETNTSRTLVLNFSNIAGTFATATTLNTAGAFEGVPVHIRAKTGTTITLATTGTVTTATYTAEGIITQIA